MDISNSYNRCTRGVAIAKALAQLLHSLRLSPPRLQWHAISQFLLLKLLSLCWICSSALSPFPLRSQFEFRGFNRSVWILIPKNQIVFRSEIWPMEMASSPRTVEEIFKDYSARRAGVVRALTYGMLLHFLSSLSLFYMCYWLVGLFGCVCFW